MISKKISNWLRSAVAAGTLAAMSVVASAGQPQGALRATVPFTFEMDGKTMPAGAYVFRPANDFSHVLKVEMPDGKSMNVLTTPAVKGTSPVEPRLVFDRGESGHVLKEVWMNGVPGGNTIPVKSAKALSAGAASVN